MKKVLFLVAVFTFSSFACIAQTILWEDNFDSYDVGEELSLASGGAWFYWNKDAVISSDQARSGSNSFYAFRETDWIECARPYSTDDAISSGHYELEFYIYVMSGYTADFFIYGENTSGGASVGRIDFEAMPTYNMVYFYGNGAWSGTPITFTPETWVKVNIDIDIDEDLAQVYINDELGVSWGIYAGIDNSSGITGILATDFYTNSWEDSEGITRVGKFYVDDVKFSDLDGTTVKNNFAGDDLKIFPQPASDKVSIETSTVINTIEIYNSFGQTVYYQNVNESSSTINTSDFESGLYLITIYSPETISTHKLIIE